MISKCGATIVIIFLVSISGLRAQEPAFFQGSQAARFIVGPDVYHYVLPCGPKPAPKGGTAPPTSLPALCWPVRAAKATIVSGKVELSAFFIATMYISASEFKLSPDDAKDVRFAFKSPVSAVRTQYYSRSQSATFSTHEQGYQFVFLNACSVCTSGTTPPPLNEAKLAAEYTLLAEALTSFETVAKQIDEVAALMRVEVMPANQPVLSDPSGAMNLYGALNERLAETCPEPARTCLQSFARYQRCAAGPLPAACGPRPACSAACNVDPSTIKVYKAAVCFSRFRDSATLVPDWTEVFDKLDAERATHPPAAFRVVPETTEQKRARLTSADQQVCSVSKSHEIAGLTHILRTAPATPSSTVDSNGTVHLAGMESHLLASVSPVYPPVAKAANISGIVILHAVISTQGTVTALEVVSGPDMLRSAALEAVRQWTYKPYVLNGTPVEVHTTVTVNFNIGQAPPHPDPTLDHK